MEKQIDRLISILHTFIMEFKNHITGSVKKYLK